MENESSWQITISNDYILNFIIYTGCAHGFLTELEVWPEKYLEIELENIKIEEIEKQWEECFNETLYHRGRCVASRSYDLMHNKVKPISNELDKCFDNAWVDFLKWWDMEGGGKNALTLYEYRGENLIYKYIEEFEKNNNRKVKPFHLYIDLVYCRAKEILEINKEYIVMTPASYSIYSDQEWWMKKLDEIG